jgi:hypothetical protein
MGVTAVFLLLSIHEGSGIQVLGSSWIFIFANCQEVGRDPALGTLSQVDRQLGGS